MRQLFLIAFVALLVGCKTTKMEINDKSEINEQSDVKTEVKQDSTATNSTTTETTEKTESEVTKGNIHITFGEGGGTFNSNTGDANNVMDVDIDFENYVTREEYNALENKYNQLKNNFATYKDSTQKANNKLDIESEVEETYQADWYWFIIIGVLLGFIAVIAIRRIPVLQVLLSWI